MANSFGLFNCKILNNETEFRTNVQLTLGGILRDTQFKFRQLNNNYHQGFELWEVEQERKVDEMIIVAITSENQTKYITVPEYIIPETFKAYYLRNRNILLVEAPTVKRKYFLRLIKNNFPKDITLSEPLLKLTELVKHTERVERANIERPSTNAEKVMLTGARVDEDILFDQLLEEGGELKSAKVSFLYGDTTHRLNISENGNLYLLGKYESIDIQLEIIRVFYEDYLLANRLITVL